MAYKAVKNGSSYSLPKVTETVQVPLYGWRLDNPYSDSTTYSLVTYIQEGTQFYDSTGRPTSIVTNVQESVPNEYFTYIYYQTYTNRYNRDTTIDTSFTQQQTNYKATKE